MTLREYYNQHITELFERKNIVYKFYRSKKSDYYYILSIKGRDKHTLKIRVSDHLPKKRQLEIPYLLYWYNRNNFPSKQLICSMVGSYIVKYKEKI